MLLMKELVFCQEFNKKSFIETSKSSRQCIDDKTMFTYQELKKTLDY